ncbi:MAG: LLM class flavin-dependent oxidoreductase, partial [Methylibium sp.]|nr:LLM class flavin-dependent oxidoreductase [Methylibium sp.]
TRGERVGGIDAHPRPPADAGDARAPELWILGSSDYGAQLAAHFGLPYAFAYFFTDGQGVEQALELYRSLYRPSERHPLPQATICVWALAADSEAEARHHALSRDRWRIDRSRGRLGPLLSPDAVAARGFSAEEGPAVEAQQRKAFVGSAPQVAAQLRELAAALELDELVVNTWAHDPAVRRHSYALLAREFGLAPGSAVTALENPA